MKRWEIAPERLERLLRTMPALPTGERCGGEEHGGNIAAVLRHPATGQYLCAGCAIGQAQSHDAHKRDVEYAVRIRRFFLVNPTQCSECVALAQRRFARNTRSTFLGRAAHASAV
jgi:hypothetical protein